ncbi:Rrf2 family transcriptional regulator [Candidatus Uhrbacteria bacterium]|nr:Rrf2 family transcriptional regulator [Candidatus Uhrbacteria bacterium]
MNKCSSARTRTGALHLTQKVDYGLFLLSVLARQKSEGQLSIRTITKEHQLSFAFLQKVARLLKNSGLIVASRGKYGGYTLAKSPKHIRLKSVIDALEGPLTRIDCAYGSCARQEFCSLQKGLKKINDEITQSYLSKTLSSLIE